MSSLKKWFNDNVFILRDIDVTKYDIFLYVNAKYMQYINFPVKKL